VLSAAIVATPDWSFVPDLAPGAHVAALVGPFDTLGAREHLELRDTLWAFLPGPSGRPIFLFRKPFKGTISKNVLEHGTAGINIDGTRVKHSSPGDFAKHKAMVDRLREKGGSLGNSWKNSSDLSGANEVTTKGRWPSNILVVHTPWCECIVGKESQVPTWYCGPWCPAPLIDASSGNRPGMSGGGNHRPDYGGGMFGGINSSHTVYADEGGASRFYPQFRNLDELVEWIRVLIVHPGGECYVRLS